MQGAVVAANQDSRGLRIEISSSQYIIRAGTCSMCVLHDFGWHASASVCGLGSDYGADCMANLFVIDSGLRCSMRVLKRAIAYTIAWAARSYREVVRWLYQALNAP